MSGKDQSVLGTMEHITKPFPSAGRSLHKLSQGVYVFIIDNGYSIHQLDFYLCAIIFSLFFFLKRQIFELGTYICLLMNKLLTFILFFVKE